MTQAEKILGLLEEAGERGVTNRQLNDVAFRYSARIRDLRKQGYEISSIHEGTSRWRFVLHEAEKPLWEEVPPPESSWWGRRVEL